MRGRGLKHCTWTPSILYVALLPIQGAWIETILTIGEILMIKVAPLAGVWIETPKGLSGLE